MHANNCLLIPGHGTQLHLIADSLIIRVIALVAYMRAVVARRRPSVGTLVHCTQVVAPLVIRREAFARPCTLLHVGDPLLLLSARR